MAEEYSEPRTSVWEQTDSDHICQICGMRIYRSWYGWWRENPPQWGVTDEELQEQLKWCSDIRLLCDPDCEFEQLLPDFECGQMTWGFHETRESLKVPSEVRPRSQASEIEVYRGEYRSGPIFTRLTPDGKRDLNIYMDYFLDLGEQSYAAVHTVCLEIAKKVFKSSSVAHVRHLRGLFTALRWREGINFKCTHWFNPGVNYSLAEHGYYLPYPEWDVNDFEGVHWPGPHSSTRANVSHSLAQNPLEIKNLTGCLLENLRPCRSRVSFTDEAAGVAANLSRMPGEIMNGIFDEIDARDMPRISSHLVPQALWKEQLKAGSHGLLPWLWDVEPALIDAKDTEPCPGGPEFEWDWELLFRQLSRGIDYGDITEPIDRNRVGDLRQVDLVFDKACTGYSTGMQYVPAGLHNRRRIWQLLEEMFVSDTPPWKTTIVSTFGGTRHIPTIEDCVPLWWTKSGDQILSEPIWIPSINNIHAFSRSLGGKVQGTAGLQYWQKPSQCSQQETSEDDAETSDDHGASVEEIYSVL
ncbi:hypothetical protein CCHR01_14505 [Colletotrichum chrysophilum]|uniref:Uncharacterized protein n=1 Tax=Colletotrichum chrysophilum TaxID=1836956 RepID=A0AAD9A816_9PEZI|nr:hypothetical protein CCHR01_14505 [Colletotrichum chrysophilum]